MAAGTSAQDSLFDWSEQDPTENFHGGDPFSAAAHSRAKRGNDALRQQIYEMIDAAAFGLTCDEAEFETGRSHQSVSPRFTELKADGRIVVIGKRSTRTGSMAGVYAVVDVT
jgi:hypothetical protein